MSTLTWWSYISPWSHWPHPSLRAEGTRWTRWSLRANQTIPPISSWHSTEGELHLSHIAGIKLCHLTRHTLQVDSYK